jgi:hypothetical protein
LRFCFRPTISALPAAITTLSAYDASLFVTGLYAGNHHHVIGAVGQQLVTPTRRRFDQAMLPA